MSVRANYTLSRIASRSMEIVGCPELLVVVVVIAVERIGSGHAARGDKRSDNIEESSQMPPGEWWMLRQSVNRKESRNVEQRGKETYPSPRFGDRDWLTESLANQNR